MPTDAPRIYEEPLIDGRVYPCSLIGIKEILSRLPADDAAGIVSIGLVHGRRKDNANARYFFEPEPKIEIYSYPASLSFRIGKRQSKPELDRFYREELAFGMALTNQDGVWHSQWSQECLERFILHHVLLHEVGHHVYRWRVLSGWNRHKPNREASERFAEDYARRMRQISSI